MGIGCRKRRGYFIKRMYNIERDENWGDWKMRD